MMSFSYDFTKSEGERALYRSSRPPVRLGDRFVPHRSNPVIHVDKLPETLYEQVIYKSLFNGHDPDNKRLPLIPPTFSHSIKKQEVWTIPFKPERKMALEVNSFNRKKITPITRKEFLVAMGTNCHFTDGSAEMNFKKNH
jgi:hypothetical protein